MDTIHLLFPSTIFANRELLYLHKVDREVTKISPPTLRRNSSVVLEGSLLSLTSFSSFVLTISYNKKHFPIQPWKIIGCKSRRMFDTCRAVSIPTRPKKPASRSKAGMLVSRSVVTWARVGVVGVAVGVVGVVVGVAV